MAELQVSRKTIAELLATMKDTQFVVPEYQRPYQWDNERCETLWEDIKEFHSVEAKDSKNEYFLGTIVTCKNSKGNIEIIDGQQRLTSILLLLRVLYFQLQNASSSNIVNNLKGRIAPCIWELDALTGEVLEENIRLKSLVVTDEDANILHTLLKKGQIDSVDDTVCKSNYYKNYIYFLEKCRDYAKNNPTDWEYFCLRILDRCILLPIECENIDSALTIFSTLNNRGMPLSDADIFKSYIYKTITDEQEKADFISQWKDLIEVTESSGFSLNDIFRYYTHVKRAKDKNTEKEIGLRRFYTDKNNIILNYALVNEILDLAKFWQDITINYQESEFLNLDATKWLQCLKLYTNEFWRYIVSVYYIANKNEFDKNKFALFLKELVAFLYAKFLVSPTVSAIKTEIYKACVDVYHHDFKGFTQLIPSDNHFENNVSGKITKGILLLYAYLDDHQILLSNTVDVEHIFPKKWQNTNYNGWSFQGAQKYLESLGNKIILEKRINIQAGNNYFGRKKEKYAKSDIYEAREELALATISDWDQKAIILREQKITAKLTQFFQSYKYV